MTTVRLLTADNTGTLFTRCYNKLQEKITVCHLPLPKPPDPHDHPTKKPQNLPPATGRTDHHVSQSHRENGCRDQRVCYGCGEQGHFVKHCPIPQCSYCCERGHLRDRCPKVLTAHSATFPHTPAAISATLLPQASLPDHWVLDVGSTHHITGKLELFVDYTKLATGDYHDVRFADGTFHPVAGIGSVTLKHSSDELPVILEHVLFVPTAVRSTISVPALLTMPTLAVSFSATQCNVTIVREGHKYKLFEAHNKNSLYQVREEAQLRPLLSSEPLHKTQMTRECLTPRSENVIKTTYLSDELRESGNRLCSSRSCVC